MNASVKGALNLLDNCWMGFTHNEIPMTKQEVKAVLEHAVKMGYETTNDIPDNEIDMIISSL